MNTMKSLIQRLNTRFKLMLTMAAFMGWCNSASPQAAVIIQNINFGASNSSPNLFTFCSGLNCIFFVADNGSTGPELWKYDIAGKTASLIKDINPGPVGSAVNNITPNMAGNGILFSANDGSVGSELWKSDGTAAGTQMVLDINPGVNSSNPSGFYPYGGTFICSADNGTNGKEPWITNGTIGGTAMLKDINLGPGASDPNNFTAIAGKVLFRANDGTAGSELWATNMTSPGTVLLKDINTGSVSSVPNNFALLGSNLIFSAMTSTNGAELWKSDGTAAGTVLVKDINAGAGNSINSSAGAKAFFTAYGTAVYFQATDGSSGYELWKTDGTTAGTVLLKDINSGSGSSSPSGILATSTNLFFFADDGATGMEIWMSDGTPGGTALLKDINPGAASSTGTNTSFVKAGSGPIYFAANDGVNGAEFWRTLGSAGSTVLMADINPGSGSSNPANMLCINNNVYFAANDGTTGIEPWTFDPLAAGIMEIKNDLSIQLFPNPNNGVFYLRSNEEETEVSIYSLLGTVVYQTSLQNAEAKHHKIDLSELSSGIYFVKVVSGQRETVKRIILSQ
jgi:trimeric autotransporter adhesin